MPRFFAIAFAAANSAGVRRIERTNVLLSIPKSVLHRYYICQINSPIFARYFLAVETCRHKRRLPRFAESPYKRDIRHL